MQAQRGWQQAAAEQLVNRSLTGALLLTLAIKYITNENKALFAVYTVCGQL